MLVGLYMTLKINEMIETFGSAKKTAPHIYQEIYNDQDTVIAQIIFPFLSPCCFRVRKHEN